MGVVGVVVVLFVVVAEIDVVGGSWSNPMGP
jgi:hypothetical protein